MDDPKIDMSRQQDNALLRLGTTFDAARGQVIVIEGEPISHYYWIINGQIGLYQTCADGRRQMIDLLERQDCFGLTSLDHHACTAEALSPTTLVACPRRRLETAIKDDPQVGCDLHEIACMELDRARRQLLLLGRMSAEERIATFLLDRVQRQADHHHSACLVDLPMRRSDIADYLGLTIETVSRILSRFKQKQLVAFADQQTMTILDMPALRHLAEGEA